MKRQVIAALLQAGRRDLATIVAVGDDDRRPAVIILREPVRPIRTIITRVLKKLRIPYEYASRATMRSWDAARGRDEPRFYLNVNDTQASQIADMIVTEQKKEGWVRGWEMYHD